MDFFLQLLFTGVGIGAVYALVALGFVLIFRATSVVNFAQGEFSMVAAYLMVVFAVDLGWPYWVAFLISIAGMAVLGAIFNLTVYYPLRHRTFLPVLISTIGASIFLSNSVLALYGPQPQVLPGWLDTPGFQVGPVYLDSQYLIIIGVTLVLVALQYWLFERTLLGKKLQATSQDKEMATLLGIPVAVMIMITFVYSAALGGIAGILVAPDSVRLHPDGLDDRAESLCGDDHRRLRRCGRSDLWGLRDRDHRDLRRCLYFGAVQGRVCFPGRDRLSRRSTARHLRRASGGKSLR